MNEYFSGGKLYGDEFSTEEIAAWHRDEMEAYAQLGAGDRSAYVYGYHALNRRHGFRLLEARRFEHALGLGSAYGDEFLPLADRIGDLVIVDPSEAFRESAVPGIPCRRVKPSPDGRLPFPDGSFDLITCLGVLHHIPNVSAVMRELSRCLTRGGVLLVREPIRSMGDWTKPRPGLTRRERGIPLALLTGIGERAGLLVRHQALCMFPILMGVMDRLGGRPFNSRFLTGLDAWLCRLFGPIRSYHPGPILRRLAPASAFLVLEKPATGS